MDTSPERFDRVHGHPDYPATAERKIELPHGVALAVLMPATFTLAALIVAAFAVAMLLMFGMPWWFVALFGLAALSIASTGVVGTVLGVAYHRAPIERVVAVVVRTRDHVTGGEHTSTIYRVTLQERDGSRAELGTSGELAGRLVVGDIGVAYRKSTTLVDFVRFDV